MGLLDTHESHNSLTVSAAKAGAECLAAVGVIALIGAVVSGQESSPVETAIGAAVHLGLVWLAAIVIVPRLMSRAGVPTVSAAAKNFVAASVWLAPVALFSVASSWWILPATGIFAVLAARAFRALPAVSDDPQNDDADTDHGLFLLPVRPREAVWRSAGTKAASCAGYVGVVAGLAGGIALAALLIGVACAIIAWFVFSQTQRTRPRISATLTAALAAVILGTWWQGDGAGWALMGYHTEGDILERDGVGLHTSMVLLADERLTSQLVAPPMLSRAAASQTRSSLLSIPFTGEYWFFPWPLRRPGQSASRKHGSPTSLAYTLFDANALVMQARQRLGTAIDLGCCRAIDVFLDSRELRPETVYVEMILIDHSRPETHRISLGHRALSPPVNNRATVRFDVAYVSELLIFDEILVWFHLAEPRQNHSARIAVDRFDLVP